MNNAALRTAPIGVLTIDRRDGSTAFNATACALLGLPPSDDPWCRVPASRLLEGAPASLRGHFAALCRPRDASPNNAELPPELVTETLLISLHTPPDTPDWIVATVQMRQHDAANAERASLAELAAAVAHGFNNLLVGVMGNLDLARYADGTEADRVRHLDAALAAAERAAELCRQLLAYSGRGPLRARERDVAQELRRILPLVRQLGRGRVELREPAPNAVLRAALDSGRFTQVMQNLVEHATNVVGQSGSIDIGLAAVSWPSPDDDGTHAAANFGLPADYGPLAWADHRLPAQGDYVALTVASDGGEAPASAAEFEPRFGTQLDGRGLGLPAAAGVLRQHGGALGLARRAGVGTVVVALWPAASHAAASAEAQPLARRDGTVLIVDDDPTVRDVLRLALERLGYRTHAVENGALALTYLDEHAGVLAIVLDQTMPVMGGAETFARLRARTPHLPVVLTSGFGEDSLVDLVTADAHAAFLAKPFALERLRTVLESVLG